MGSDEMWLTNSEYEHKNPSKEDMVLKCEVCGDYGDEVATCNASGVDAICDRCATEQGMFFCERCSNYAADFGPGGEDCQSCYERSIDAAHDAMKEAF